MASSTMDSLFDNERFTVGHQNCLPLVIYTPFGLVLCIVRFFILLQALIIHSIIPQTSVLRSIVLRVMLTVTGLVITTEGDEGRDSRARVLVANHVSPLDHMVTSLVVPHILPVEWEVFKVKFLPVTQKKETESEEEFCERVRGNMARSLELQLTDISAADVMERRKRPPRAAPAATQPSSKTEREVVAATEEPCLRGQSPQVVCMVRQIKEVLTEAPTPAILKDILVTKDVDLTITNFLEGRIPQETSSSVPSPSTSTSAPPSTSASTSPSSSSSQPAQAPASLQFKASEFGKNTKDRHLSFQERKEAMLEAARRKYRAKHGIPEP